MASVHQLLNLSPKLRRRIVDTGRPLGELLADGLPKPLAVELARRTILVSDMTEMQQTDLEDYTRAPAVQPESKPKSHGYGRLRARHHRLIAEHESLKADYEAQQIEIGRLLAEHKRLMAAVRSPQQVAQVPWFEGANQVIAQLAANPEPRALQVMTAALAGIQQRLAQIIMRVTV
jgi:hypothetical protein